MGIIDDYGEFLPGTDSLKPPRYGFEVLQCHFYYADVDALGKADGGCRQRVIDVESPRYFQGKFRRAETAAQHKAHTVGLYADIFGAHFRVAVDAVG